MQTTEIQNKIRENISVTREDIARAKSWIIQNSSGSTPELIEEWLRPQNATVKDNSKIDIDSDECLAQIKRYSRAFSLRLTYFQAQWELIAHGELLQAGLISIWKPILGYKSSNSSGPLSLPGIECSFPSTTISPPLRSPVSLDMDVFLNGTSVTSLHSGIREAINQSLICFHRGLYMPSIAMLSAAAEATWTECGIAVSKKLSAEKLESIVNDPLASISKKVIEIQKVLQSESGRSLLKSVGQTPASVNDSEVWTTNLRYRRNALHWGKAKSFVVDHSEAANLLMGSPLHIGTLEAIRVGC